MYALMDEFLDTIEREETVMDRAKDKHRSLVQDLKFWDLKEARLEWTKRCRGYKDAL
jgi:hypothetical protein